VFGQDQPQCPERVVSAWLDGTDGNAEDFGGLIHGTVAQDRLVQHFAMGRRERLQGVSRAVSAATPCSTAFHRSPVIRQATPAAVVELSPGTGAICCLWGSITGSGLGSEPS
jgi:hypothetical protein